MALEEIASQSFLEFLLDRLAACEGVLEATEAEAEIEAAFRSEFSKADLRKVKGRNRRKWQNTLDWAKASGTRRGLLATVKFGRQRWIVLLDDSITAPDWVQLAKARRRNPDSFKKRCHKCKQYVPLARRVCPECGNGFPPTNPRRRVTPR